jgi:hypothetical protein
MMSNPQSSGLYVVVLKNDELISVNAHDSRRAARCLHVNKLNVKVGKAKDFAARRKSYARTFGEQYFKFIPIVAVSDIGKAEKVVKDALAPWRVRHTSGRLHEWLAGITPDEVERTMLAALIQSEIDFERINTDDDEGC